MVGAADFFKETEEDGISNVIIGDIIIVCAQVWHDRNLYNYKDINSLFRFYKL